MTDSDEKTRVTAIVQKDSLGPVGRGPGNDCLVVIYTKEPTLLGKRFVLDGPLRIGRGPENHIVLEGDSVSRKHAEFELHGTTWYCLDRGSTNGTFVNDTELSNSSQPLQNGDRVKVGPTIFKYLSGHDVEAQYHEEIYRMTIIDGLTQAHVKRFLLEALEKEIVRARRHARALSFMMFDIDHFKSINDKHGHLAGDYVLKELARIVQSRVRRDEVFARYGGEEFALILPETPLDGACGLAEGLRAKVDASSFTFQNDTMHVTVSIGLAELGPAHKTHLELIKDADAKLYDAKRGGRNRVAY